MPESNAEKYWRAVMSYKGWVLNVHECEHGWQAQYLNYATGDIVFANGATRQLAIIDAQANVDMLLREGGG